MFPGSYGLISVTMIVVVFFYITSLNFVRHFEYCLIVITGEWFNTLRCKFAEDHYLTSLTFQDEKIR